MEPRHGIERYERMHQLAARASWDARTAAFNALHLDGDVIEHNRLEGIASKADARAAFAAGRLLELSGFFPG